MDFLANKLLGSIRLSPHTLYPTVVLQEFALLLDLNVNVGNDNSSSLYALNHLFDSRITDLRESSDVIPSQPVKPFCMNSDHALAGTVLWSSGTFTYVLPVIQWSAEFLMAVDDISSFPQWFVIIYTFSYWWFEILRVKDRNTKSETISPNNLPSSDSAANTAPCISLHPGEEQFLWQKRSQSQITGFEKYLALLL